MCLENSRLEGLDGGRGKGGGLNFVLPLHHPSSSITAHPPIRPSKCFSHKCRIKNTTPAFVRSYLSHLFLSSSFFFFFFFLIFHVIVRGGRPRILSVQYTVGVQLRHSGLAIFSTPWWRPAGLLQTDRRSAMSSLYTVQNVNP